MSRLLGHFIKQKRQKRKDVRAVKSNVSDAAGDMDSSEQTVLSSAVSWMSAVIATKWHRSADCSTHEPLPPETPGHRLLTGASQARRVCSLMPSEDTAGYICMFHRACLKRRVHMRGVNSETNWKSNLAPRRIAQCCHLANLMALFQPLSVHSETFTTT